MANSNSTVLNNDAKTISKYDDYAVGLSYKIHQLKSRVSGARSLVYECELEFKRSPNLLDAAYVLDEVIDEMVALASAISATEFLYQVKAEKV